MKLAFGKCLRVTACEWSFGGSASAKLGGHAWRSIGHVLAHCRTVGRDKLKADFLRDLQSLESEGWRGAARLFLIAGVVVECLESVTEHGRDSEQHRLVGTRVG